MQDLGRIIIDINENGGGKTEGESGIAEGGNAGGEAKGGAASAAAKEAGKMAMIAEVAGAAFSILAASLEIAIKAIQAAIKAIQWMHENIMATARDLHDYSPAIALAEMDNQLKMMSTKFRLGAAVGGQIGGYMKELGAMERSIMEIKTYMSAIFAVILKPLLKVVNAMLDWFVKQIPNIMKLLGNIIEVIVDISKMIWSYLYYTPTGFAMSKAGFEPSAIWNIALQVAKDVKSIKFNTEKEVDYSSLNAGFIGDLRLMGARI